VRTEQPVRRLDLSTNEQFIAVHTPGRVCFHLVDTPDTHITGVELAGELRSVAFCENGLFVCVVGDNPVCWLVEESEESGSGWSARPVSVVVTLKGNPSCVSWVKRSDSWLLLVGCTKGSFCLAAYIPDDRQPQIVGQPWHSPFDEEGRFVRALLPLGDDRVLAVYASALR
jgi:hypothetical protein